MPCRAHRRGPAQDWCARFPIGDTGEGLSPPRACHHEPIEQEAIALVALHRLHATYADVTTRRAWDELGPLFVPDCPITIDTRGAEPHRFVGAADLASFIDESLQQFEFFQFVVLNSVFTLPERGDANRAVGRMYMSELRQRVVGGSWSQIYGLYQDRYVRIDARWRFAERRYSTLARPNPDVQVFPAPPPPDWETV